MTSLWDFQDSLSPFPTCSPFNNKRAIVKLAFKLHHGLLVIGGGVSYFPYILLNEIQTMFSQLAKRSPKVLPVDLCTDHVHYIKNNRSTVLRKNKSMAVEGRTVSHYYILVTRKFIDFMSLFRHSVWFSLSVKQFPFAEFGICNI